MTLLRKWIWVGLFLGMGGNTWGQEVSSPSVGAVSFEKKPAQYTVTVHGDLPSELQTVLQQQIPLLNRPHKTVRHVSALKRRFQSDLPQIQDFLSQKGYYDADISFAVVKERPRNGERFLGATLYITTGAQYHVENFDVKGLPQEVQDQLKTLVLPQTEDPFDLERIDQGKHKISGLLRRKGYLFHEWSLPHLKVDHKTKGVQVTLHVAPGPQVYFGPTYIQGLKTVKHDFVRQRTFWKEGDLFDESRVHKMKKDLTDLNLFGSIQITHGGPETLHNKRVPSYIELAEQPHRYIGAGLKYAQASRIGGRIFWGHNNLWDRGERLEVSYRKSRLEHIGQIQFKNPGFQRRDQHLTATLVGGVDTTPAYTRHNQELEVLVERTLSERWRVTLGGAIAKAKLSNIGGDTHVTTYGMPCHIRYDRTNQELDPSRGVRAVLTVAPYGVHIHAQNPLASASGESVLNPKNTWMVDQRVRLSGYYPFQPGRWVGAVWGEWAMIHGTSFNHIPADKRYYAGGENSVRGYSFQKAETFGVGSRPQGGRSLLQWGTECRFHWSDHLGMVVFWEGAQISRQAASPLMKERMFYGYGAGIRYHTDWGPFRFDLAFPGRKRPDIDAPLQFYVGLGQAF